MSSKVVISKSGFNVLTETDPNNLIFSSDFNHLKNKLSGDFTEVVANSATFIKTVAHGLSSVHPLCMAYFRDTASSNWYVASADFGVSLGRQLAPVEVELYTDDTNVYIKIYNNSGSSKTVQVQYEIFYESA